MFSVPLLCIHALVYLLLHWLLIGCSQWVSLTDLFLHWHLYLAGCSQWVLRTDLFCLFRGIVAYMMEHEDVIKIPVNLKELQSKIKYAQTQLSQVSHGLKPKAL